MPEVPTYNLVDAWLVLMGVVAPLIAALINQPGWSTDKRRYVAAGVCTVLGLIYAVATQAINVGLSNDIISILSRIIISTAVVITIAQGMYKMFTPAYTALQGEPKE